MYKERGEPPVSCKNIEDSPFQDAHSYKVIQTLKKMMVIKNLYNQND